MKENAERAIKLDARNGAAYMTLGAWHFYVADLSWVHYIRARACQALDNDDEALDGYRRCIALTARNAKERQMQADARSRID